MTGTHFRRRLRLGTPCLFLSAAIISCGGASTDPESVDAASGGQSADQGSGGFSDMTSSGGMASADTGGSSDSSSGGADGSTSSGGASGGGEADASGGQSGDATTQPSEGCGSTPDVARDQWVQMPPLSVSGSDRDWWMWLPESYDPSAAYPLVVLLHGCGNENNNVPIQKYSNQDAIVIRGVTELESGCWSYDTDPNVLFVDAMLDAAEGSACVDESRVFAAGFSSGSWLISRLTCERADRFTAVGTVAGGNVIWNGDGCMGHVGAIYVHDENDLDNDVTGSTSVRDRLLSQNECSDDAPTAVDPAPCESHPGCPSDGRVTWCMTQGEGHSRQDEFAGPLMWDFFSSY